MTERIEQVEQEIRRLYQEINSGRDDYPATEAEFSYLAAIVRQLNAQLLLRSGLRVIEGGSV